MAPQSHLAAVAGHRRRRAVYLGTPSNLESHTPPPPGGPTHPHTHTHHLHACLSLSLAAAAAAVCSFLLSLAPSFVSYRPSRPTLFPSFCAYPTLLPDPTPPSAPTIPTLVLNLLHHIVEPSSYSCRFWPLPIPAPSLSFSPAHSPHLSTVQFQKSALTLPPCPRRRRRQPTTHSSTSATSVQLVPRSRRL